MVEGHDADRPAVLTAMSDVTVQGHADARFRAVADAFAANFDQQGPGPGECGAALAVYLEGELVVDLWGGYADRERSRPWEQDTIVCVMSTTKGAASLCAHRLADEGKLDFDAPVARYWPEFAAGGKASIPVHMLLSHRSGLAAVREPLAAEALFDWGAMTTALARAEPWWEPGTMHGYHAFTFGWLVGELVRRIDGRGLGTYFRDEIAGPLGLDWLIGFGPEHDARVAQVLSPPYDPSAVRPDPESLAGKAVGNPPGIFRMLNTREWRAAEIPAANGHTNARAAAWMYAALAQGGELDGVRVVSQEAIERAIVERSNGVEATLGGEMRFGLGFQLNRPPVLGPNPRAFGHAGYGGSLGFADPDARLGFGYTPNQYLAGLGDDPRRSTVLRALYDAL